MNLQEIHVNDAIIKSIIKKEFKNLDIKEICQYHEGWIHKKFRISFEQNHPDVVLRFPAEKVNLQFGYDDDYSFDKEIFVSELISKETSIKVPKILNRNNHDGIEYLILEKLDGCNLCNAPQEYNNEILLKIIYQWGSAMSQIHQIKSNDFGYIGRDGIKKSFDSWGIMFEDFLRPKLESDLIPPELRIGAKNFFVKNLKELNIRKDPTLILYDVQCGNVIVRDGKFFSLLDFDCALYGDRSLDFTFIDLSVGDIRIREPFLNGYTESGGQLPQNLDALKKLNTLNFYLSTILNYHVATGRRETWSSDYTKKLEQFLTENG